MAKVSFKKFAVATGLAAIGGYIAGLLTAPKSGRETRSDLETSARLGIAKSEEQLDKIVNELNEELTNVKNRAAGLSTKSQTEVNELVSRAKVAKDKAQTVLKAVRSGKSKDEDLSVAVNEVNRALQHLKTFLKK